MAENLLVSEVGLVFGSYRPLHNLVITPETASITV